MGISSIKRTSTGIFCVRRARLSTSSELKPPISTQFSFTGDIPTSIAASMPDSASASFPVRVMLRYFSSSSVSRLMFMRCIPAS